MGRFERMENRRTHFPRPLAMNGKSWWSNAKLHGDYQKMHAQRYAREAQAWAYTIRDAPVQRQELAAKRALATGRKRHHGLRQAA